jgi:putative ABC transport system permease protein
MPLRSFPAALQGLMRDGSRGYAAAAIASLALGIGASIAIYGLLHAVLIAPLALRDEARVMRIAETHAARGVEGFAVATGNYLAWREGAPAFAAMAAFVSRAGTVSGTGEAERVETLVHTPALWEVTAVAPRLGRTLRDTPQDIEASVMIDESYWDRRFARSPAVLGQRLRLDGRERVVVGVAPSDIGIGTRPDLWVPFDAQADRANHGDRRLTVVGRLAEGASRDEARAQVARVSATLAAAFPDSNEGWSASVEPVRDWLVSGEQRERLLLLLGAVGLLLLMACANLASLQLARGTQRQREIGVRQALGAAPARLRSEFLVETSLLLFAGAGIGLLLAGAALQVLQTQFAALLPAATPLRLSPAAATIAIAACSATAFAFALVPATLLARTDAARLLGQARGAIGVRPTPLRQGLVVGQFALATLLICAALLLGQRLHALLRVDLGFEPGRVLTANLALPAIDSETVLREQQRSIDRLLQEIGALPGVAAAGIASDAPLGETDTQMEVGIGPKPLDRTRPDRQVQASWRIVGGDYFSSMGIALLRGRAFAPADEAPDSVIIGHGLAERLFGAGVDPVGRTLTLGNQNRRKIVGVVADTRQRSLQDAMTPTMYFPTSWYLWESMTLVVRGRIDAAGLAAQVRERAAQVLPDRPLFAIAPLQQRIASSVAAPRLQALVVLLFACAALVIASVGIGSITRWTIARRRAEFALRIALGASPAQLGAAILGGGAQHAVMGIGLGAIVIATLAPMLRATLPVPMPGVALATLLAGAILVGAAILACWRPARRAATMAPAGALNLE